MTDDGGGIGRGGDTAPPARVRRPDPAVVELVEECEAFLEGCFAERLEAAGARVPVWAWLNLLAHGTEAELLDETRRIHDSRTWHRARAFLAGELLDLVHRHQMPLRTLQRRVLVPIELRAVNDPAVDAWTPAELVRTALVASHADTAARR